MVRINLIIFGLFLTFNLFGQYPRIILKQLQKADSSGQFIIADSDSNAVWSDALYITTDSLLTLYGDTIEGGINYEKIQDTIAAMLEAGLGIQMTYNDADGEFLIESLSIEDSIYNGSGSLINKGTPLYAVGTQGNYWNVAPADASDITKLPAVVIAGEDIGIGETGVGLLKGHIKQVNTTGLADGDEVYVGVGGGYTNVKPKGESNYVQRLGTVIKGNSASGSGIINLGEVQSVSNLNAGNIFIGDTDSTITTTVYIVDSSRVNATGDSLIYYQNGIQVGADAIDGALSGLVEDQVIFGAADGSLEQDSNLVWDGLRLNIGQYLNNVFIGYNSGNSNVSGTDNTALGTQALGSIASGLYNTAIGDGALSADSSGNQNVAIGRSSLILNKTGFRNTAIGNQSLNSNVNGFQNIGIGYIAGGENVSGFDNIFIGSHSGRESTGDKNIFIEIGLTSASNTLTGDNNIVIGYSLQPSMYGDADNNILIGNDIALMDSVGDNQLNIANAIFGVGLTGSGTTIDSSASIGINNNNPTATLDVTGWVNVSDSLVVNDIRVTGSGGGTINGVTTDATLTGDGTSGTPLSVVDDGHNHVISNVDNLQTTLDGKQAQLNGTGFVKATGTTISYDNSTYLTTEVDGSVTNEIQDISTSGAAGNISISSGSTLNLNVDDADASATNEGSLTVGAGGANDAVISSNTSGSSDVTISGGTNVTVTESGQTITIASSGGAIPVDTFVTIAGTETITGAKTFTSDIVVQNEETNTNAAELNLYKKNGSSSGDVTVGDNIGNINFKAENGATTVTSASIEVDATTVYNNEIGGDMVFKTASEFHSRPLTEAMRIDKLGNISLDSTLYVDAANNRVGIGTTTPSFGLEVNGTGANGILSIFRNGVNGGGAATLLYNYSDGKTSGDGIVFPFNMYNSNNSVVNYASIIGEINSPTASSHSGNLLFNTSNSAVSNERMRITSDGNVGIGTTSPSAKLQVDFSNYETGLLFNNTNTQYGLIGISALGVNKAFIGYSGGNAFYGGESGVGAVIQANGRYVLAIDTSLNVYLGDNTLGPPTEKLDVDGNARFRSIGSGASAGALHYTSTGVLTTNTSDIRLKTNLQPLENTLQKLLNINTYSFNWINETNRVDLGMVAQQVEEIFPRLVFTNPVDGYKGIHYDKFSSILTKAIQEQQSIIESQATEIEQLKTLITELSNRLTILENN